MNITGLDVNPNITFHEILIENRIDPNSEYLYQTWNLTQPTVIGPNLSLATASHNLEVYVNITSTLTQLKYYINTCTTRQSLGLPFAEALVNASMALWSQELANFTQVA